MFNTNLFIVFAVLLACSLQVFASSEIIRAKFVERRSDKENAYNTGTLYYYYDDTTPENSLLSLVYNIQGETIRNLYDYKNGALFSMCTSSCTSEQFSATPAPWFYSSTFYGDAGTQEGSYYWFSSKSSGSHVKKILMGKSGSAHTQVSKIEFRDGITLTLSDVALNPSGVSKDSDVFKTASNCPVPTCVVYADMVFVLQNKKTQSSAWNTKVSFVTTMLDHFTLGPDAVQAAVVQYQGSVTKECVTNQIADGDSCKKCFKNATFNPNSVPNVNTASTIAGGDTIALTGDCSRLTAQLNNQPSSNSFYSCQGFGLALAADILKNSPRKNDRTPPQPIIFVLSDGTDYCPNETETQDGKLKQEDGVLVFEIGVGVSQDCNKYDEQFLKRMASALGSAAPAYFAATDTTDISKILSVIDQVLPPVCDSPSSPCGLDCKGFCGCGKCYCPQCDAAPSKCYENTCRVGSDQLSSTGCVLSEKQCHAGNVCTSYTCNPSSGDCEAQPVSCDYLKTNYPGTCHSIYCDANNGGCKVSFSDDYCQDQHGGNACEIYECARAGVTPQFSDSGCVLKSNKTQAYEATLQASGKFCVKAVCDTKTGTVSEVDNCVSSTPKCYTSKCEKVGNNYQCKESPVSHPSDTKCTKYKCDSSKGWVVGTSVTMESCVEQLGLDSTACMNVYCNANKGCVAEVIEGCTLECDVNHLKECLAGAARLSSTDHCIASKCNVTEDQQNAGKLIYTCDYGTYNNCYDKMEKEVEKINANNPEKCYTPACSNGNCAMTNVEVPSNMAKSQCKEPKCVKQSDRSWNWEYVDTLEAKQCVSDECYERECLADKGCVATDICTVYSNKCVDGKCIVVVPECSADEVNKCLTEGAKPEHSSTDHCVLGKCNVSKDEDVPGKWSYNCDFGTYENCYDKMEEEVAKLNENNSTHCHTPVCDVGRCAYTYSTVPSDMKKSKCKEPKCVRQSDKSWKWEYVDTVEAQKCKNEGCYERECIGNKGCVETDICSKNSTVCTDGKCVEVATSSVASKSNHVVVCPDGQYEAEGVCHNCSSLLSCYSCSDATSCDSCRNGYKLDEKKKCKLDCEFIFGDGCSACTKEKCVICSTKECCLNVKNFFWDSETNSCMDPADKFGKGCLETDGEKCTKCTAATCCGKKQFFDTTSSSCEDCTKFGDECSSCGFGGCLKCDGENKITDKDGKCVSCSELFGVGCKSCDQTSCLTAEESYVIVGSKAKQCTDLFGRCKNCTKDGCTECQEGLTSFSGFCKNCSDVFGNGCMECNSSECTKCKSSDLILVKGVCADCATAYGEGCTECDSKKCSTGSSGYFVGGGRAVNCSVLPEEGGVRDSCKNDKVRSFTVNTVRDLSVRSNSVSVVYNGNSYEVKCSGIVSNCELCSEEEGLISCSVCAEGFVLYGGICVACESIHGDLCHKCSLTSCEDCGENLVPVSGVCQTCEDLYPSCSACNIDSCTKCEDGLVSKNGRCVSCQSEYDAGCYKCDATGCISCAQDSCCPNGTQLIITGKEMTCGTCDKLTPDCATCTWTQCLTCRAGMTVDPHDSYKCKSCSKLFPGCSECDSDICKACENSAWILTDNGCLNTNPESKPSVIPSSSSKSKPSGSLVSTSSGKKGNKTTILIISIVGGVVAVAAIATIITLAIYCGVKSKKSKNDSAFIDDGDAQVDMTSL